MTAIKIYYKDVPGHNLVSSQHGAKVWTRNTRSVHSDYKNSLYPLLDLLGIDYTFSQDSDSIPMIDVGSLHPSTKEFFDICKHASESYKKAVVFSTQEPWQWPLVEKILNTFNNLFLFDAGTPLAENGVFHDRYGNFPAFFVRMFTPRLHIAMAFCDDLAYKREYKKIYSCLMARWRPEKHLLFSMLAFNNLLDKGYVTFNPLLSPSEQDFHVKDNEQQILQNFKNNINVLMPYHTQKFKDFISNGLYNFQSIKLNNDVTIDQADYDEVKSLRPSVKWFDPVLRAQPKFIYEESCFSLVCESFSGIKLGQDSRGMFKPVITRSYITEKSMTPILNGHPTLVFGEAGFYSTLEDYGFASHEELFDLGFDNNINHGDRIEAIKNNMCNQDIMKLKETLWNLNSETNKKIRHNKHNLYNTNSKMWNMVRQNITNIFDRVRDLNV